MRRLLLAAALAAGSAWAVPASATTPMNDAIALTLQQSCLRFKAANPSQPIECGTPYKQQAETALDDLKTSARAILGIAAPGPIGWFGVLRAIAPQQPMPVGGSFGGGGAGGSWDIPASKAENYCENIDYELDAQGNLIIPSMPLSPGGPMTVLKDAQSKIYNGGDIRQTGHIDVADSPDALALWTAHHMNSNRADRRGWLGVWRFYNHGGEKGFDYGTVAYYDTAGTLVPRGTHATWFLQAWFYTRTIGGAENANRSCPEGGAGGGSFHFYLHGDWFTRISNCVMYSPNPEISTSGYYYPEKTTIPKGYMGNFPADTSALPCGLDMEVLRKIADGLAKKIAQNTGTAHNSVETADVRTSGTNPTLGDLRDEAQIGDFNNNNPTVPTQPPSTPSTGTGGDECDFGANGCTDPGTGAPTLENPPTGTMDPIFDWLPDLPSITFDTNNSECPVWAVNLTSFGGPDWQWLMDSHCTIFEANRAIIGALMIALFGVGAALIILRA